MPKSKERKHKEALARQEAYSALSNEEKLKTAGKKVQKKLMSPKTTKSAETPKEAPKQTPLTKEEKIAKKKAHKAAAAVAKTGGEVEVNSQVPAGFNTNAGVVKESR